jgi:hypothetical protein
MIDVGQVPASIEIEYVRASADAQQKLPVPFPFRSDGYLDWMQAAMSRWEIPSGAGGNEERTIVQCAALPIARSRRRLLLAEVARALECQGARTGPAARGRLRKALVGVAAGDAPALVTCVFGE